MAVSHLTGASPLVAAMIALTVAQTLKIFTHYYAEKRWDLKRMVSSGGMPSSHSATVMGLTATIGLANGPGRDTPPLCLSARLSLYGPGSIAGLTTCHLQGINCLLCV